jgi:chemotaxis methyl-accepting protein methylase
MGRIHRHDMMRNLTVGCATGEEAYSIAILLMEKAERHEDLPKFQVSASDCMNVHSSEAARVFIPVTSRRMFRRNCYSDSSSRKSVGTIRKEVRKHVSSRLIWRR